MPVITIYCFASVKRKQSQWKSTQRDADTARYLCRRGPILKRIAQFIQ